MKKSFVFIFLMVLLLSVSVFGADRVDMIVLLDNSVSVLPYYDQIQKSLLGRIISEHLKPGDTFSLITFADIPEVEISREIKSNTDIEEILAYSLILQPMGNYTDLVLALRFLYKYTLDLPLNNRKKIIILTDGIHDPPANSPYNYIEPDDARVEIKKAGEDIRREGWDVSIVEIEEQETEENVNVIDTVAESLGSTPNVFMNDENDMAGVALGIPLVSIPEHLGETSGDLIVPLKVINRSNEAIQFSVSAVISEGVDILKDKSSLMLKSKETGELNIELLIPAETDTGEMIREIELKLVGGLKSVPEKLSLRYTFTLKGNINRGMDILSDWRVLAVIIAVIIAILIIVLIKRASASYKQKPTAKIPLTMVKDEEEEQKTQPANYAADVNSKKTAEMKKTVTVEEVVFAADITSSDEAVQYHKNRPIRMFVYGQNTKMGITNTQWLTVNKKRSIGSASSSPFRIFFIKVPALIARIECTGQDFIFYPETKELFPELDGPLHDCLNKRIQIINEDRKMFYIEFRQWVSELERINRLLSITHYTGKPDMEF